MKYNCLEKENNILADSVDILAELLSGGHQHPGEDGHGGGHQPGDVLNSRNQCG